MNLRYPGEFVYNAAVWDILFGSLLWSLWLQRNAVVFNGHQEWRELVIVAGLRLQHECIASSLSGISSSCSESRAVHRLVRWEKPPMGWCKLNTDGAVDAGSGAAACGGAVRDSDGRWLIEFTGHLGVCSVIESELWGVYPQFGHLDLID
ncbi:hypothetical protein V6N11_037878 [Hibiscus sabdariffa]|uniref:RNase H type-1 domain-containing protein n=2 Tax=Hibiscus sabdariffa TaxID=183260 RepID=A0ABR2A6B2_9ROSI